jgi:hypothetical protein
MITIEKKAECWDSLKNAMKSVETDRSRSEESRQMSEEFLAIMLQIEADMK